MNSARLLVIDDHPIMRDALAQMFVESKYRVLAKGQTANAIQTATHHQADVMVLGAPDLQTLYSVISAIALRHSDLRTVVYAGAPTVDHAVRCLEAGAKGYAAKTGGAEEILQAVDTVYRGEIYISRGFASGVITSLQNASVRKTALQAIRLSVRENQIIHLLLGGRTNREIARQLTISEKTVKHYMTALMQKLNARNRVEAVIAAQQLASDSFHRGPPQLTM